MIRWFMSGLYYRIGLWHFKMMKRHDIKSVKHRKKLGKHADKYAEWKVSK